MASWTEMSGSAKGGVVAVVVAVLGLIGWFVVDRGPGPQPPEETAQDGTAEPAASETAAAPATESASADPASSTEPTPETAILQAPTIDVLRVSPDGSTTLAGRTEAQAAVSIQIDGTEIASVTADGSGQFASLFTLAPSESARLLTLVAKLADGTELPAAESVAIAPVAEPSVEVAANAEAQADTNAQGAADPAAPAAIKLTEDGAELVQPAEPVAAEIASEVSLDVISYTADGDVQLGGRGTVGAAVRLYLDNVELATTTVGADGAWSLISAAVAPGIYTLRVDQLDAAGAVTSRLETPFKRETLEALAAAASATTTEVTEVAAAETTATEPSEDAAVEETLADAGADVAATDPAATAPVADAEAGTTEAPATEGTAEAPAADAPVAEPESVVAAEEPAPDAAPAASAAPVTVTVQPGFTLWAIAKNTFGSGVMYVLVYEANKDKIKDPDLIYPGQVFSLPASP